MWEITKRALKFFCNTERSFLPVMHSTLQTNAILQKYNGEFAF